MSSLPCQAPPGLYEGSLQSLCGLSLSSLSGAQSHQHSAFQPLERVVHNGVINVILTLVRQMTSYKMLSIYRQMYIMQREHSLQAYTAKSYRKVFKNVCISIVRM